MAKNIAGESRRSAFYRTVHRYAGNPEPNQKTRHRSALAEQYDLDPDIAWLYIAAMMRDGAKTASFWCLVEASRERPNGWFHSLIARDGPTWTEIEAYFAEDLRRTFLGLFSARQLADVSAAADTFI